MARATADPIGTLRTVVELEITIRKSHGDALKAEAARLGVTPERLVYDELEKALKRLLARVSKGGER